MIAYARIHRKALKKIEGVFAGVTCKAIPSRKSRRIKLSGEFMGPSVRHVVSDRLLVIRSRDLDTIEDRCRDFGIEGLEWTVLEPSLPKGRTYTYRARSGAIHFRIGALKKERTFQPEVELSSEASS